MKNKRKLTKNKAGKLELEPGMLLILATVLNASRPQLRLLVKNDPVIDRWLIAYCDDDDRLKFFATDSMYIKRYYRPAEGEE